MRSQTIISFFVLLFVLFVAGCAEDPNPVGARLVPDGDLLHLDTLVVTATRSYNASTIPGTSGSSRVLVGGLNNLQCWGLVRFSILPDSILNKPMLSAELDLRTVYHFGDSLASFSMTVHQILMNWTSDSLTIDSLKAAGFYSSTPSGTLSAGSVGDTATITIPLDTTMIRSWGTSLDSVSNNFGVLLRPTNSAVVKGFASFLASDAAMYPRLLLRFLDVAGNVDTLIVETGTQRFVTTGMNPAWASDNTHLFVMNGGASRGYVEFDVSRIPLHAAVHKATLALTFDAQKSVLNSYVADSAYAYYIDSSSTTRPALAAIGSPVQSGNARIYQFPIGSMVQQWVRIPKVTRLAIAGFQETEALDLFSFYGAQSAQGVKPKLTIVYSVLQ